MVRMCWLVLAVLLGGCGGEYVLTAPDVLGLPGESAPAVIRLQRREFWFHAPPCRDAAIIFCLDQEQTQCARTDKAGYAAVGVMLPESPGRYRLSLHHQDTLGDTVSGQAWVYVLSPDRPVVAVEVDGLPAEGRAVAEAAAALERVAEQAELVYATQESAARPELARRFLHNAGYPDGPVLPCVLADPWYSGWPGRQPQEPGMLEQLRQRVPAFRWAVTARVDTVEAFRRAGLEVILVGDGSAGVQGARSVAGWGELSLPATGPTSQSTGSISRKNSQTR